MSKSIFESKGFKKIMAMSYGLGAAIVILGAMFKILHWPGAGFMLALGLSTEAIIFIISAFEPIHQEPDWTLVYPELAGMEPKEAKKGLNKGTVTQQLDKMLEEAKVGPELISSLGNGLKSLSDNVTGFKDLSNATLATNEYATNVQKASKSIEGINGSYVKAVEAMNSLADSTSGTAAGSKDYQDQMQKITKNLASLNSVYELEIAESNNQLKSLNGMVNNLTAITKSLSETEGQANQFKVEIGKLTNNLANLNAVYGNMLSAMTVTKN